MGWQLIESQSLQASAASVTFSSIPQTYKTLKLIISSRGGAASSSDTISMTLNSSSANFTFRQLYGTGSAAGSNNGTAGYAGYSINSGATANTFSSNEVTIPNYTSTSVYKPISIDSVQENNSAAAVQVMLAELWSNNSAVTSITLTNTSIGDFVFGSTFTLYGLI